jgi:hypothetical protein
VAARSFSPPWRRYVRSEQVRSDLYIACAPLIRSGRVELLDHPKMLLQFTTLERKVSPSGRDQVNHVPGGHNDVANAVAGALVSASNSPVPFVFTRPIVIERERVQSPHIYSDYPRDPASYQNPALASGPAYGGGHDHDGLDAIGQFFKGN